VADKVYTKVTGAHRFDYLLCNNPNLYGLTVKMPIDNTAGIA